MTKRLIFGMLIAVLAAVGGLAVSQQVASAATPVRIMPLGDSITGSPGCWRALLWNRLQSSGYTNIDFVGTQSGQSCGVPYDSDGEGHGGYLVTNVAGQGLLPGWLSSTRPDIVLMHFGTNDVWNNISASSVLAAYGTLVDQMRASNPRMKIVVAKIIPLAPTQYSCPECPARVVALNNAIPAWASGKSTSASPITVVDQWSGFNSGSDTVDGVHPNDSGNAKMSNRWYSALTPLLTSGGSGSGGLLEGFESGSNGWTAGGVSAGPWRVSEWAAQGSSSLKADVALGAGRSYSLLKVATQNLSGGSTLKATVRAATWGALGSGMTAKIYVKTGSSYTWYDSGLATITTGSGGSVLSLTLSGVANRNDVREIGVQFFAASNSSGTTSIYLDNVTVA
jgi:hypothetical protein